MRLRSGRPRWKNHAKKSLYSFCDVGQIHLIRPLCALSGHKWMFGIRRKFLTLSFGDSSTVRINFFTAKVPLTLPRLWFSFNCRKSRDRRQKRSLKPSHVVRAPAIRGHIGNCLVKCSSSYSTTIADTWITEKYQSFLYHFSSSSCATFFHKYSDERSIFHDISHSPCNCSRSLSHTIARNVERRAERNMPKKGNNERNRPLAHRHEAQPSSISLSTKLANCSDVYSLSLELISHLKKTLTKGVQCCANHWNIIANYWLITFLQLEQTLRGENGPFVPQIDSKRWALAGILRPPTFRRLNRMKMRHFHTFSTRSRANCDGFHCENYGYLRFSIFFLNRPALS